MFLVLSRYEALHAGTFLVGLVSFVLAMATVAEVFLPLAGACFAITGVMTIAGHRIAMHGPLGAFFRHAIGGVRRGSAYLVGGFWLLLGLALLVAAGFSIAADEPEPPEAPVPTIPAA